MLPADYTEEITSAAWSSDDETVATVSSAGQVTALKAGTAHIKYTITCTSGTFSSLSAVTVSEVTVLPDTITVVLSVLGGTPSFSVETYVIGTGSVLRTAIIFFYLSNEGVSLLENASYLGLPVPQKLKSVLEQLHDRAEKEDE